jgi:hypothetical protein
MRRFENELPVSVLKMIIKEIDKESAEKNIDWTYDDVYDDNVLNLIDSSLKKFGITDIDWEDYGFFWKLYQDNHNFNGDGDITIPRMMEFPVTIRVDVSKQTTEKYLHSINTYSKDYVSGFIYNDPDGFDYYTGEFIDEDIYDSDTGDWEITHIGKATLVESKRPKKVLTESQNRELQDLLIMKKTIEQRIKTLSS